jgi:hypothetical protein
VTIAGRLPVGNKINVPAGYDDRDPADRVDVRIVPENPIAGQVVFDRKSLEAGRAEWASATLAHLLRIVEYVDHRTDVFHCAETRIGVAVGIDQAQDVVAVPAVAASSRGGRGADGSVLGRIEIRPENLAG